MPIISNGKQTSVEIQAKTCTLCVIKMLAGKTKIISCMANIQKMCRSYFSPCMHVWCKK